MVNAANYHISKYNVQICNYKSNTNIKNKYSSQINNLVQQRSGKIRAFGHGYIEMSRNK